MLLLCRLVLSSQKDESWPSCPLFWGALSPMRFLACAHCAVAVACLSSRYCSLHAELVLVSIYYALPYFYAYVRIGNLLSSFASRDSES